MIQKCWGLWPKKPELFIHRIVQSSVLYFPPPTTFCKTLSKRNFNNFKLLHPLEKKKNISFPFKHPTWCGVFFLLPKKKKPTDEPSCRTWVRSTTNPTFPPRRGSACWSWTSSRWRRSHALLPLRRYCHLDESGVHCGRCDFNIKMKYRSASWNHIWIWRYIHILTSCLGKYLSSFLAYKKDKV